MERAAMRLRVGIDARFVDPAYPGIGRYVAELAPALTHQPGIDQLYVFHRPGQALDNLADKARPAGLFFVEASSPVRSLAEQIELPRLARQHRLEVFHAPYLLAPMRLPCPMVVNVYDLVPLLRDGGLSPTKRAAFRQLVRLALRRADSVITLSEPVRRQINAAFPHSTTPIRVTPAAAGPQFRPIDGNGHAAFLAEHDIPDKYVLYVGANRPHKNLPRLLDAWEQLGEATAATHLLLAGYTSNARAPILSTAAGATLDNVRLLGRLPDATLPSLYSRAHGYVQPSIEEGFGFPVLEAMACGVPVACSATAALQELTGAAAIHFDPYDVSAIGAALRQLLSDEHDRAARVGAGLARAAELSWKRTAASTVEIYRDVARPAKRVA